MVKRLIDGPASTTEIVGSCTITGILLGSVLGLIAAGMPLIGGALGGLAGASIGWCTRNIGKKPGPAGPEQRTTQ